MKKLRPWALLALATALFTAASVSPAAAGGHASEAYCEPGSGQFNMLNRLVFGNAKGTFDRRVEPRVTNRAGSGDGNGPNGGHGRNKSKFKEKIDVYFHVITDGMEGHLSRSVVDEQIDVLNETFAGRRGGANTGFRFKLKKLDYTNNGTWFDAFPESPEEEAMKRKLKRGGLEDLNIYSTSGGDDFFLGWAWLAEDAELVGVFDGVVIHWGSTPGGPITFFNLGFTATHEVGHWLGLYHTFDFGCVNEGDLVEDTPEMSIPTSGCPEGKDTCPQPGLDPIHNYMDYSIDECYTEFTRGQSVRMQDQWDRFRENGRGDDDDDRSDDSDSDD